MGGAIRVGAVSFLNAKPLYHRLEEFAPDARLSMDLPSRLADGLARGDLDVALIPSIEYFRGASRGYEIVPGLAIASWGPVRSVKLFSRVPIERIGRLALDAGSRTSQALVRIWLAEVHGVVPARIEPLPMGVPAQESTADAVLVIGDRAMKVADDGFVASIDLAEAWRSWTGLPFVFALWVARAGADLGDLPDVFLRCRDDALAHADDLAALHGPRLGLDAATCRDYLTKSLSYDLGEPETAALRLFAHKAAALGLAPQGADLVFHRRRPLATRR
ncbi:MAG TPA: menaquinone biosynthesis protein [Isosphaeraceae bacterium]|nr:menaquinone biosynthesis protein [Isosphaeraceae bacterium]